MIGALVVLGARPASAQAATSGSFRVEPELTSGASMGASASFRLDGCLDHNPSGIAGSTSYRVQTGCGATLGGPVQSEVPALSGWGEAVLVVLLACLAVGVLRRRPQPLPSPRAS
jgi:hypothetical protein